MSALDLYGKRDSDEEDDDDESSKGWSHGSSSSSSASKEDPEALFTPPESQPRHPEEEVVFEEVSVHSSDDEAEEVIEEVVADPSYSSTSSSSSSSDNSSSGSSSNDANASESSHTFVELEPVRGKAPSKDKAPRLVARGHYEEENPELEPADEAPAWLPDLLNAAATSSTEEEEKIPVESKFTQEDADDDEDHDKFEDARAVQSGSTESEDDKKTEKKGFFSSFKRNKAANASPQAEKEDNTTSEPDVEIGETKPKGRGFFSRKADAKSTESDKADVATGAEADEDLGETKPKGRGFFSRKNSKSAESETLEVAKDTEAEQEAEEPKPKGRGFFSRKDSKSTAENDTGDNVESDVEEGKSKPKGKGFFSRKDSTSESEKENVEDSAGPDAQQEDLKSSKFRGFLSRKDVKSGEPADTVVEPAEEVKPLKRGFFGRSRSKTDGVEDDTAKKEEEQKLADAGTEDLSADRVDEDEGNLRSQKRSFLPFGRKQSGTGKGDIILPPNKEGLYASATAETGSEDHDLFVDAPATHSPERVTRFRGFLFRNRGPTYDHTDEEVGRIEELSPRSVGTSSISARALFGFAVVLAVLVAATGLLTSYYGTKWALNEYDLSNSEALPSPTLPPTPPTPNKTSICEFSDIPLEFRISFDSKPAEVGITLTDSIQTDFWSFPGGSFRSFSQFQRNNFFMICLNPGQNYAFGISDSQGNGLVSDFAGTPIYGSWELFYNGTLVAQYVGNCEKAAVGANCGDYCACDFDIRFNLTTGGCRTQCS